MAGLLEREELLAALAAEATRGGRLVFLGGEAGVGKTALVRAFVAQSAPRVLQGSCENLATPIPLGPFADVAAKTEGALAELLAAGADARRVARALLDELARPAVVVLEDVHWADEATLDALRVLGRRVDDTRGLVVATYRDDEVDTDHPLRAVLGELASAPGVARLSVPRLSLGAVRTIAGATGADGDARLRADGRERLLRHRGPGGRLGASAGDRPRRRAGPDSTARRGGAAPARHRRARSRQGGASAARGGGTGRARPARQLPCRRRPP